MTLKVSNVSQIANQPKVLWLISNIVNLVALLQQLVNLVVICAMGCSPPSKCAMRRSWKRLVLLMQKVPTAVESSPSSTALESEFMARVVCFRNFAQVVRISVTECLKNSAWQKSVKSSVAARNSVIIIAVLLLLQQEYQRKMMILKIVTG